MRDEAVVVLVCPECDAMFAGTHDLDWHLFNDHLFSHVDRFLWSLRKEHRASPERVKELREARTAKAAIGGTAGGAPRHPRPSAAQRIAARLTR